MTRETPPDDAEEAPDAVDGARDADEARVEELRERIARGEYRVDPEAIARRILERGDLDAAADEPAPPALRLVEDSGDDEPPGETVDEAADEAEEESGV